MEAETGVEEHQSRAGSDPDPQDARVWSFANFVNWGSKTPGLEAKRPFRILEINRKRNRNAWAAAETAEMFLQKVQLTGPSHSANGPIG